MPPQESLDINWKMRPTTFKHKNANKDNVAATSKRLGREREQPPLSDRGSDGRTESSYPWSNISKQNLIYKVTKILNAMCTGRFSSSHTRGSKSGLSREEARSWAFLFTRMSCRLPKQSGTSEDLKYLKCKRLRTKIGKLQRVHLFRRECCCYMLL